MQMHELLAELFGLPVELYVMIVAISSLGSRTLTMRAGLPSIYSAKSPIPTNSESTLIPSALVPHILNIINLSPYKKMLRINACGVIATMADNFFRLKWSIELLRNKAVGVYPFPLKVKYAIRMLSTAVLCPLPFQTIPRGFNPTPESLFPWLVHVLNYTSPQLISQGLLW